MAKRILKYFFFVLGLIFVGLGAVGAVIPLLPTVPFMILALGCFTFSSDRLHDWIYNHRIFGPQLQLWKQHRVIPMKAKLVAVTSMLLSLGYMVFILHSSWILVIVAGGIMAIGAGYILTKPSIPPV